MDKFPHLMIATGLEADSLQSEEGSLVVGSGISAKETSVDCVTAGAFNCPYASKRIFRSQ